MMSSQSPKVSGENGHPNGQLGPSRGLDLLGEKSPRTPSVSVVSPERRTTTAPAGSSPTPNPSGGDEFDWGGFLDALLERAWLPVVTLAVGLFASYGYYMVTEPMYRSTGTIQVEAKSGNIMGVDGAADDSYGDTSALNTLMLSVGTFDFMTKVINNHDLTEDPLLHGPDGKPTSSELAVEFLQESVRFRKRPNSYLIDVIVDRNDPVAAQKVCGSILEEIIRSDISSRSRAEELASDKLFREAQRLREELNKSEQALLDYSQQYDSVSLEERQQVLNARINEFEQKILSAKQQQVQLNSDLQLMNEFEGDRDKLLKLPSVKSYEPVAKAKEELERLEEQNAVLGERYGRRHPRMVEAQAALNQAEQRLQKEIEDAPSNLESSIHSNEANIKALEESLKEFKSELASMSENTIRYRILQRDVNSNKMLYEAVTQRFKETEMTKGLDAPKMRLIQQAILPGEPHSPNIYRILGLGIFLGLGSGIGLVYFFFRLDDSLKSVDQIEDSLGFPVLSAVPLESPHKEEKKAKKSSDKTEESQNLPGNGDSENVAEEPLELEAVHHPDGKLTEAFRSLRASLTMLGNSKDRQTFLVTSAIPSEGKTFCSISTAIAFAQVGERVLIIDADLRKPRVGTALLNEKAPRANDENPPKGVTSYLAGHAGLQEVVRQSPVENLYVITAGPKAPNPAELLGFGESFAELLEEAKKYFHRIFIDTPPVHAVSDCLAIAPNVQTTVLVVRCAHTSRRLAKKALQMIEGTGCQPAGVVLNMVPQATRFGYYYSYQQYGQYGYGNKVYGTED